MGSSNGSNFYQRKLEKQLTALTTASRAIEIYHLNIGNMGQLNKSMFLNIANYIKVGKKSPLFCEVSCKQKRSNTVCR